MERGGDLNKLIEKWPKSLSYILISSERPNYSLLDNVILLDSITFHVHQNSFPNFHLYFRLLVNDDDPSIKCGCCKNWDNEMSVLNNMVAKFI